MKAVEKMEQNVSGFLKRFHSAPTVDEVFTNGCCYWFAYILFRRFLRDGARIMYDEGSNHFGTMIGGRVYDVTGDVTDCYTWKAWDAVADLALRKRVVRDCIDF